MIFIFLSGLKTSPEAPGGLRPAHPHLAHWGLMPCLPHPHPTHDHGHPSSPAGARAGPELCGQAQWWLFPSEDGSVRAKVMGNVGRGSGRATPLTLIPGPSPSSCFSITGPAAGILQLWNSSCQKHSCSHRRRHRLALPLCPSPHPGTVCHPRPGRTRRKCSFRRAPTGPAR